MRSTFSSASSASSSAAALHSPDFYAGDPYPTYRELRATSPVCWNNVTKFWALLKYEDVRFASSNPAIFSSAKGVTIPDPAIANPVQPGSLIFTDPPRHRQLRKLINSGFTRRQTAVLEPKIRQIVRGILDGVEPDAIHEFAEEIDGHHLSDDDLLNFAFLLLVAGNETTRNLIALGTLALIAHPEQCRLLVDNPGLIPGAVEEMLRWSSPVVHMARTATTDVEIRGQLISAGEVVVLLYGSANRDEDVFGCDSEEFKVTRHSNPHIAFGCGEHSCLGAQLARLEACVLFDELLRRFPRIELVGDVDRMRATMIPDVKRMPARLRSSN